MGDLPVLEWDEGHRETLADIAELGVVKLMAWSNRWRVDWFHDCAAGDATSRAEGREKCRAFAKTLLQQVLAQLDRTHDAATGMAVQLAGAELSTIEKLRSELEAAKQVAFTLAELGTWNRASDESAWRVAAECARGYREVQRG